MELRFVHVYPDLMNLYGGYANLAVLRRLLERMGHTVRTDFLQPSELPSGGTLSGADFLYMGAGTERRQRFAMEDFSQYGETVKALAEDGHAMLFAGTAMELLGASVTTAEGEACPGIGLAGFTTVQSPRRIVGDVFGSTDLYPEAVVGFMNKCGVIAGVETPLLRSLDMGFGNQREKGPEGFHDKNVFASELTGPILVKNPRLLETVAAAILTRRGVRDLPAAGDWPTDPWAEKGYTVTARELRLRCQGGAKK